MRQISLFKTEFENLLYDAAGWDYIKLSRCSMRQLQTLCVLMNISRSGKKEALTTRLLAIRDLRLRLSKVQAPEELMNHSLKELKAMCSAAKIWRSGNKYSLSAGLLNWRNRCRSAGQKWLKEALNKNGQEVSAN